jgi:hypothetical protein
LQKAYEELVLSENGSRIYTPYDMNPRDLETIMGVSLDDVESGKEFRKKSEDGHFKKRVNGLKQPDELTSRYIEVSRVVFGMAKKSMDKRAKPAAKLRDIPPAFNKGC